MRSVVTRSPDNGTSRRRVCDQQKKEKKSRKIKGMKQVIKLSR